MKKITLFFAVILAMFVGCAFAKSHITVNYSSHPAMYRHSAGYGRHQHHARYMPQRHVIRPIPHYYSHPMMYDPFFLPTYKPPRLRNGYYDGLYYPPRYVNVSFSI